MKLPLPVRSNFWIYEYNLDSLQHLQKLLRPLKMILKTNTNLETQLNPFFEEKKIGLYGEFIASFSSENKMGSKFYKSLVSTVIFFQLNIQRQLLDCPVKLII